MKRVIFVNGTSRCGSTMVDLMLGNDPVGFSLGEVGNWFRPWRTHHFDIKCGCGVYPCPVWDELREVSERDLYHRILNREDLEFIVDSSKRLTWVIDQNRRLERQNLYDVRNIVLYKAPVSLFYSRWKRGMRDPTSTARQYDYYVKLLAARIPFVAVNYDWLISDMTRTFPLVCDAAGMPYRSGKEHFWEKTHHHLFGSFGPRKQLFSSNPSIYKEVFSPDYQKVLAEYHQRFLADSRLQAVLRALTIRDVRNTGAAKTFGRGRVRRPFFYYKKRLNEIKDRFFPAPWPDYEAATIQEWRI